MGHALGEFSEMPDAIQSKLQEAYELIRQERFEEAQIVLQPVIFGNPSADAWWLWANAVTEPEDARHALRKVLEVDPQHDQANAFLRQLDTLYPAVTEADEESFIVGEAADFDDLYGDTDAQPAVEADIPAVLPPDFEPAEAPDAEAVEELAEIKQLDIATDTGADEGAVDFSGWLEDLADSETAQEETTEVQPDAAETPRRSYLLRNLLLVTILLVVGIGLAYLVLSLQSPVATTSPAESVFTDLAEPSDTLQSVMEAAQRGAEAEAVVLGGEPEAKLVIFDDDAALLVRVCRGAEADLPTAMDSAMALAARYGISAQDELMHVGATLVNCDRQDTLLEAFTSIEDAAEYASGSLSAEAFRLSWTMTP